MKIEKFRENPVMGILRGATADAIPELVDACIRAGLGALEITMNTPDAPAMIAAASGRSGDRIAIGAGTVLSAKTMREALDAGARFIVSPVLEREVVAHCVQSRTPVFPGAFSPDEIHKAWQAGATMVKVFPAKTLGPEYFREIKGPFEEIELLACGGIRADTVATYAQCGASAVAFGGSVFAPQSLADRDFDSIEAAVRTLVDAWPGPKGN